MRRARGLRSGDGAARPPARVDSRSREGTPGGRGAARTEAGAGWAWPSEGPARRRGRGDRSCEASNRTWVRVRSVGEEGAARRRGQVKGSVLTEGTADPSLDASPPCRRGGWRGASLGPPWPVCGNPLPVPPGWFHTFGGPSPTRRGRGGPPRSQMPRGPAPMSL